MMRFSSFVYLVGQGLHNMKANRLMTFASMGVLTVCMILIGTAFLFGINIDSMVAYLGDQNYIVAFLERDLSEEQEVAIYDAICAIPGVADVTYSSPEDFLDNYSDMLEGNVNMQEVFAQDNPFHPSYQVVLENIEDMDAVAAQLNSIAHVVSVKAPTSVQRLFLSLQKAITYGSYGLVAVLGLVSMIVIHNTIRLTAYARRREIGIMKLVGATNGFIRFPFFVEGTTSGLISAAVASGIVCGAYYFVEIWYSEHPTILSDLFGNTLVPLNEIWYFIVISFVIFGFVLCGIGTATSIRKHLRV